MKKFYPTRFSLTLLQPHQTYWSSLGVSLALAAGLVACDNKPDVQRVTAQAAAHTATPIHGAEAGKGKFDPELATALAAVAKASQGKRGAGPLPPGHDNTLPPGHPPISAEGAVHPSAPAAAGGGTSGGLGGVETPGAGPSGRVDEVLQAGRYTYLRIGKEWSAVPVAHVRVGQDVAVVGAMKMLNFVSKVTGRTFPEVWFGNLAVARTKNAAKVAAPSTAPTTNAVAKGPSGGMEPAALAALIAAGDLAPTKPTAAAPAKGIPVAKSAPAATSPTVIVAIDKATGAGAYTVAEVIAKRAELAGKIVRIKGKVVKFNAEILDRNWVHLQDGSGDGRARTHDLTITTQAVVKVGDVVTLSGVVVLNRDFGAGYSYAVLVEKADIVAVAK